MARKKTWKKGTVVKIRKLSLLNISRLSIGDIGVVQSNRIRGRSYVYYTVRFFDSRIKEINSIYLRMIRRKK